VRTPIITTLLLAAALGGCANAPGTPPGAEQLTVQVVSTLPHDPAAFTEGLEFAGDTLYESTGLSGQSQLTAGPPGGPPRTTATLPSPLFGEGVTVLGPTLWQLTWQDGFAIERDTKTLAELRRVPFQGEGWGLCHQDTGRLVMSNGSSQLTFRDPKTFAVTGSVDVGRDQLNELECVGGEVYANVWHTDTILRIDAATGHVTATIDAGQLRAQAKVTDPEAVLNGIAAVPGTGEFLLAGKQWQVTFRVRFVPQHP
jgi:glutamine cyclotransferase